MPVKLSTSIKKIESVSNDTNRKLIYEFLDYMRNNGSSEHHQNNNLKVALAFVFHLGKTSFYDVNKKEQILNFLNEKIKNQEEDPDKRWITTWNHYLHRIKLFMRWLHNKEKGLNDYTDWESPDFLKIKSKKTKRLSPYLESELWEKDELLTIVKYETSKRNKAVLTLLWDLDARPHELTLLKIKHIRLKEKYGEGEIPHEAKTGSGPVLLTCSFPYVRDWLNEHPFRNQPDARLICDSRNGGPIKPDAIWALFKQLKIRLTHLLESGEIKDNEEKEKIEFLLKHKKFNPYCIRHSAITADSDYLPEYALKKKVRWTMNSKQGNRYIKRRMGNDLKEKILSYNGIVSGSETIKKPTIIECPRCSLVNQFENKYCSKCSYPLKPDAYDEIKESEEKRIQRLEEKYDKEMKIFKENIENKIQIILEKIEIRNLF